MRTEQLLLSGLDITEDGYIFKGQFILSNKNKSKHVDMEELEQRSFLEDLKNFFELEEPIREIRNKIIDRWLKAQISSKIRDGRNYEELFANRRRTAVSLAAAAARIIKRIQQQSASISSRLHQLHWPSACATSLLHPFRQRPAK